MEETRQKVINQLDTLREVKFVKPTKMDLRNSRHLVNRVQRQEDKLYKQRVLKQQKDLKLKLAKIDKYNVDLKTERARRLSLLSTYENSVEPTYPVPVFQPIDLVVPRPSIGVPRSPIRRRSRIRQRIRKRNLRRVR